jgi:hypothetical protein
VIVKAALRVTGLRRTYRERPDTSKWRSRRNRLRSWSVSERTTLQLNVDFIFGTVLVDHHAEGETGTVRFKCGICSRIEFGTEHQTDVPVDFTWQ